MSAIDDSAIFAALEAIALNRFDGHYSVMRFTTTWKVQFGPPPQTRDEIDAMPTGQSLAEAFLVAVSRPF